MDIFIRVIVFGEPENACIQAMGIHNELSLLLL